MIVRIFLLILAIAILYACVDSTNTTNSRATASQASAITPPTPPTPQQAKVLAQAAAKARSTELANFKKQGVSIGMTAERVLQSNWGKPTQINRTTTSHGTREQWVYRGQRSYLYFEDGILTSIQN